MITIVDCGINNLRSVEKAFEHLGFSTQVTREPDEVARAEKIVLPGVGAFATAMKSLNNADLVAPLLRRISAGAPFLGICLAQQLLFDWSEEMGLCAGLGVLSGKVVRLPEETSLKIPHIGWSALAFPRTSRLMKGVQSGEMVYFVHSYGAIPEDETIVAATANHGAPFVAAIECDNVMATQFHPEKSSDVGLRILRNFAEI